MQKVFYRFSWSFKGFLFGMALVMVLVLLGYTQRLINALREESRQTLLFYKTIYTKVASPETSEDELMSFIFDQIVRKTPFPLIYVSKNGDPIWWKGIKVDPYSKGAQEKVRRVVKEMEKTVRPIALTYQGNILGYLYYGDSPTIRYLRWMPYIQIGLIGLFIFIGILGFSNIRKSEQHFIWVGMAKETAHQLGTPLSSLMGWLEILKSDGFRRKDLKKTLSEMERDVERLSKVISRFSQIGSKTTLKEQEVAPILSEVVNYFRRRLPHVGKEVQIIEKYDPVPRIPLNKNLFEWGLENLIKNSLEAIEKKQGRIEIHLGTLSNRKIYIDVKDNGRGIEFKRRRDVFKPGYTTKKRGWGLGLSLAKRIIEEYHGGKLILKESKLGEGTTMRIVL